jgi:ribosomal protein S18 acetylase RimI-like enzyme
MAIRDYNNQDEQQLVQLIAEFRVELSRLKSVDTIQDLISAKEELQDYLREEFPIFVAVEKGRIVGYLVCRIDDDVVWTESIYVSPDYRRKGIASNLHFKAVSLSTQLGGASVFYWVHPNNDSIIAFLRKNGYSVLNLIEIRGPWKGEELSNKIRVGVHEFDY